VPADVQLSYYDVEGTDQATLLSALNARGATQGQASWKLSYQYVPKRGLRDCTVGTVSTKLELGMTLPRWTPPAGTPPELIGRWERFLKALVAHQNARLDGARELERSLAPALASLAPAADCPALDAAVKERYAALEEETRAKSQQPVSEIVFE
jgi:predicted secreted Zn-dependent protease